MEGSDHRPRKNLEEGPPPSRAERRRQLRNKAVSDGRGTRSPNGPVEGQVPERGTLQPDEPQPDQNTEQSDDITKKHFNLTYDDIIKLMMDADTNAYQLKYVRAISEALRKKNEAINQDSLRELDD